MDRHRRTFWTPARRVWPVYADNDPMVLAHARALLSSSTEGKTAYIDADLRNTRDILDAANATNKAHNVDFRFRTHAEVSQFFTGLQLVEPGIVPVTQWRPDGGPSADPADSNLWAGVGRLP